MSTGTPWWGEKGSSVSGKVIWICLKLIKKKSEPRKICAFDQVYSYWGLLLFIWVLNTLFTPKVFLIKAGDSDSVCVFSFLLPPWCRADLPSRFLPDQSCVWRSSLPVAPPTATLGDCTRPDCPCTKWTRPHIMRDGFEKWGNNEVRISFSMDWAESALCC